ncbi:helix-turn-helix domain-containing protein [Kineococcus arenarius]|uniref:helix-turn-helix domain-containing protein n=1 Tax=Kineococcus sp. SYSU DK007 TaxID=3383128 RepID=UPI003D7D03F5
MSPTTAVLAPTSTTEAVFPDEQAQKDAALLKEALLSRSEGSESDFVIVQRSTGKSVEVPIEVERLLGDIAAILERGQGAAVSSVARELTTTEAANLLGVSRPTLVKLLDAGKLHFRQVGRHRRVFLDSVLAYRQDEVERQRQSYAQLRERADSLGI